MSPPVHPRLDEGVWIAQPYIDHHYDPAGGINIVDGHLQLPAGPGLGIAPDHTMFGEQSRPTADAPSSE